MPRFERRSVLDIATNAVILITCVILVAANWSRLWPPTSMAALPKAPVSLDGATFKGDPESPIVVVEWSDYQCPYCAQAEKQTLAAIDARFIQTGKVQLAVRHHPLTAIHPQAQKAAEAALCAGRQGRFWEMHTVLFQNSKNLTGAELTNRAAGVGLDLRRFAACLERGEMTKQVEQDVAAARTLGLSGTPVFLIGRRQADGRVEVTTLLSGARPLEAFVQAIESAESARSGTRIFVWLSGVSALIAVAAGVRLRKRQSCRVVNAGAAEDAHHSILHTPTGS